MNVGIYFNIVPKGNDKLSLYFENKNSTLKLHSNKDSDNAQWEVKWLGAENGKYGKGQGCLDQQRAWNGHEGRRTPGSLFHRPI
ncbi:hypothetical protein RirG_089480 [Rhizophagus irregularis DAOM 197198w]|uniref:Uncharacterized protein n=1 Tax=Rhizophagus irregularis (strain DAOM 197198w) TaxID=1432141 RepID=A0A015JL26_RHIIW|nr:hypothetical protein RirG_089480 [Rhizophagus irregularis DAOM 197198w]